MFNESFASRQKRPKDPENQKDAEFEHIIFPNFAPRTRIFSIFYPLLGEKEFLFLNESFGSMTQKTRKTWKTQKS